MSLLRTVRVRPSPRVRAWLVAAAALVSGALLATARQVVDRPPLVIGQDGVAPGPAAPARVTLEDAGGPAIVITPVGRDADTLLVLYAGGLVRPQAYEWLGRALAARGVQTVIPVFPLDLAVTGANRADAVIGRYGEGRRVVLAGHSLGGAMAAQYAAARPDALDGLVLMAAYPAGNVDLRARTLPTLSLLAGEDRVADEADVRGGVARLPAGTTLTVIPGAVHAFFGRYGPQRGDGIPTVTRAEAEGAIVAAVETFLARTPPPPR